MPSLMQLPQVLTMTIAEVVHRDGCTGKYSLLGLHNTIAAPTFPCTHPSLAVYLALTDGRGKTPLTLRLIDGEEERPPVFTVEALLDFPDPTQVVEGAFTCQRLQFPQPGEYRLQLLVAGELLLERRLFVRSLQMTGPLYVFR
jgi:hypothetical protein